MKEEQKIQNYSKRKSKTRDSHGGKLETKRQEKNDDEIFSTRNDMQLGSCPKKRRLSLEHRSHPKPGKTKAES